MNNAYFGRSNGSSDDESFNYGKRQSSENLTLLVDLGGGLVRGLCNRIALI